MPIKYTIERFIVVDLFCAYYIYSHKRGCCSCDDELSIGMQTQLNHLDWQQDNGTRCISQNALLENGWNRIKDIWNLQK